MNRWAVVIFLVIFGIFGVLLFMNSSQMKKSEPILPPEANTLQILSPSPQQGQSQAAEQPQQAAPQTFGVEEGMQASYSAVIKTTKGDISVVLFGDIAPRTVKNFIEKANKGFYNKLTFHRVEDWVVQGGDPKGNGTGGELMQTELNRQPFVKGSLGVARGQDIRISNDSQFFITKSDASWLDQQYTNFGMVTEGMDVVEKMQIGDKIIAITINK